MPTEIVQARRRSLSCFWVPRSTSRRRRGHPTISHGRVMQFLPRSANTGTVPHDGIAELYLRQEQLQSHGRVLQVHDIYQCGSRRTHIQLSISRYPFPCILLPFLAVPLVLLLIC